MCSTEILLEDRNCNDADDVDVAKVLLSLNKLNSSRNHCCHTIEKGISAVTPVFSDLARKSVTTAKQSTPIKLSKQRMVGEIDEALESSTKKYEFSLQDYHIREGEQQNPFICDICGKLYGYTFSLKRHYLRTHINFVYLTPNDVSNCNISESNVKKHYEKHKVLNFLKASHQNQGKVASSCSDSSNEESMFPNLFCCNICDEMFNEKESLKQHLSTHASDKINKENKKHGNQRKNAESIFFCQHCLKNFHDADSLRKHEETHKFCCEFCPLVFKQNYDLKRHVSVEHLELYHPCFNCQEYFSTQQKLQEHLKEHNINATINTSSLPYQMNDIDTEDKEESLRLGDKNSHLKFGCTVCKKRFNSYDNMRRHRRLVHNSFAGKNSRSRSLLAKNSSERREAIFFENVSSNIADNLINNIDGKNIMQESVESFPFIETETLKSNIPWSVYNFPVDFNLENVYEKIECKDILGLENNVEIVNASDFQNQINPEKKVTIEETSVLKERCNNDSKENQLLLDAVTHPTDYRIILSNSDSIGKYSYDLVNSNIVSQNHSMQRKQLLIYVCNVCCRKFYSKEAIEEHKLNNHMNVLCTHMELDESMLPYIYVQNCSPTGAICHCKCLPLTAQYNKQLICTKCKAVFNNKPDFHLHILECGSKTTNINKHNSIPGNINKQKICTKLIRNKTIVRRPGRLTGYNLCNNRFNHLSIFLKNRIYKRRKMLNLKFKNKLKESCENKQNSNILHSTFSEVVRSKFKKIVSNLQQLDQKQTIELNGKNSILDLTTKEHAVQIASIPSNLKKVIEVKSKFSKRNAVFKENMQPLQNWCLYCKRPFIYRANYRKHMEDCPAKKDKCQDDDKLSNFMKQDKPIKMLSVRSQVKQNIIGLLNNQSPKSEINGTNLNDKTQLNMYQCPICHKSFLNIFTQMACIMSHKLHSDESSALSESSQSTEGAKLCKDHDSSETKSKSMELSVSSQDITVTSHVAQSAITKQFISNTKRNKDGTSYQTRKENNISPESNTIEECFNSSNVVAENKIKYKDVLCNENIHSQNIVHKQQYKNFTNNQAASLHIHKMGKSSTIHKQKNEQKLITKRKNNSHPVTVPSKQNRKTLPAKKMSTKVQSSSVTETSKVFVKKRAQQKSSRKYVLGRKPTTGKKCKS